MSGREDGSIMKDKIKVLIVDDSALVRETLKKLFDQAPDIEVIDAVMDPLYAVKRIKQQRPDVITLDMQMPRMDGLTFLKKLMASYPVPVVVISSKAIKGGETAIKALELGAVDFITKPEQGIGREMEKLTDEIFHKVRAASQANIKEIKKRSREAKQKPKSDQETKYKTAPELITSTNKLICLGASTGGTVAIRKILQELPANLPGIITVIHMPSGFTKSFADTLDVSCDMKVKEAEDGEPVNDGVCYIAPGGYHLEINRQHGRYYIKLNEQAPINNLRPAIDKLFYSAAEYAAPNCMGGILTGMGKDGAQGLKKMRQAGAYTIAQDEKTSVVYGMPKQALTEGGVEQIYPLDQIPKAIVDYLND